MNRLFKTIAVCTAFLVASGSIPVFSAGASAETGSFSSGERKKSAGADVSCALPRFMGAVGQEIGDLTELSPVTAYGDISENITLDGTSELPEKFDMREAGTNTPVKEQGSYGACWSFSAAASAESGLNRYEPSVNLSEWHTAFYTYYGDDQVSCGTDKPEEIVNCGGTCFHVTNLWAQWRGPVSENRMKYGDFDFFSRQSNIDRLETAADYHLENAWLFDYDSERSNKDAVDSLVKQFVAGGKAVDVSFSTLGYSKSTNSVYSTLKPKDANHSVTVIGWDDNFPASSFGGDSRPENNGAWLAQNSWDVDFGDNGCFWISYEDTSLSEFAVFELGSADEYTTNYQHDTFYPASVLSADDEPDVNKPSYMANIFTADRTEQLEAIGTYINSPGTEYEITIYTDLQDVTDPASGTPSSVTCGTSELTGFTTIELDENVLIEEGELFSVSVKLYCPDSKYVVPVELCLYIDQYDTGKKISLGSFADYDKISANSWENESFVSTDGVLWDETCCDIINYTDEEKNEVLQSVLDEYGEDMTEEEITAYCELFSSGDLEAIMGNVSLKAFAAPVGTVDFSHASGNVPLDETVELSVKDGSEIYVSVNGGGAVPYEQPLKITEYTQISATTDFITYTQREYTPAKAEFTALGYFTDLSSMNMRYIGYAERTDESSYSISLSGDEDEIALYPVSAAEVYMDGTLLDKNCFGEGIPLKYGANTVTFQLKQENRLDNTVTLNIYRSPVTIDIETETIQLDNADSLTAEDGHIFADGESLSDHAGQTLTAEIAGETVEVSVPERAALPELEIDYYMETLGCLPEETAEKLEYSVDGSNFISADKRIIGRSTQLLRVIPGEQIILRISAGKGLFASEPKTFNIPSAGAAPEKMPEYTYNGKFNILLKDTQEYLVLNGGLSEEDFTALAENFGYTAENFEALMQKRFGTDSHDRLLQLINCWWSRNGEYQSSENITVAVRFSSNSGGFASVPVFAELSGHEKGDINNDGRLTPVDASLVLMYYAQKNASVDFQPLDEAEMFFYDYTGDGAVTPVDASAILSIYAEHATALN